MADSAKNANYTEEKLQILFTMYEELGNEGIPQIAAALGKPDRSIRSKLVKEGKYVPSPKASTRKTEGPSAKELLREIENKGFPVEGFERATKPALARLLQLLEG